MMKKIILILASIMFALALAPQASALPLFARQTGMECVACHFQHFPLLNSFGRAFKSGAYTMMGAQSKVEGERLSIPNTLNMSVLTTAGYEKSNMVKAGATGAVIHVPEKDTGDGAWYLPGTNGELSVFFGGRVSDDAGFLAELGMVGGAALGSAKLPILFEVADGTRAGVVAFTTDGQGASYGFELLNTGANAIHQMSPVAGFNDAHSMAISAQQYILTEDFATGIAFVVNNPKGFINITKFQQMGPTDQGGTGASMGSTYGRLAGTFDVAGWDMGVGIQSWSGKSLSLNPAHVGEPINVVDTTLPGSVASPVYTTGGDPAMVSTKARAIDGQMQGELGGKPVGFYVSYARAPVVAPVAGSTLGNAYNFGGTFDRSSLNISGEVGVIPEKATLGAAIRRGKSGVADIVTGQNATDNAIMLTATYKLAQNMMLSLSHTNASGGYWYSNAAGTGTIDTTGSKTTTLNLFTVF